MAIFNTEDELREFLKKQLKNICHFQRIETGSVASGVPDLNLCYRGVEYWVELKMIKGTKISFRPTQIPWNIHRAKAGGRNFVLAADNKGQLHIWHGRFVQQLMDRGLNGDVPRLTLMGEDIKDRFFPGLEGLQFIFPLVS